MPEHPFGPLSLLPPLVAILLAAITRRVVVSLLAGVLLGALIQQAGDPAAAFHLAVNGLLLPALRDKPHLQVFGFTLLMGAMVGVVHRSGGMHGLVDALIRFARGRRGGQTTTWLLGLIIFFDDYANSLLLGTTLRGLSDRLHISRQKLAYLVDSTAAPVAGLALVSTWIATEVDFIASGFQQAGANATVDAFALFVATIPYRFYPLGALLLVGLVAITGRDFGPMLSAERRALAEQPDTATAAATIRNKLPEPEADTPRRWTAAVVPILLVVVVTTGMIVWTGLQASAGSESLAPSWMDVVGHGDSYLALLAGSVVGLAVACAMSLWQRTAGPRQVVQAAGRGAQLMFPALIILWLAWALSSVTGQDHLGTGGYLAGLIQQRIAAAWMPTVVFLIASVVAFATGTSWGTMGILMPLVIGVMCNLLAASGPIDAGDPILLATVGSVLAGAIFGDHCSPISDTTVLSSQASGCDHLAHVWTQLPYALTAAAVAVACGTLPVGWGVPVWPLLPLGAAALVAAVWLFGRRPES